MKEQLLELLQQNARLTNAELAVMLDTTEAEVADAIRALENDGVIKGYSAIVDDELANKDMVTAIIELRVTPQRDSGYEEIAHTIMQYDEVESIALMAGAYDLSVTVRGTNVKERFHVCFAAAGNAGRRIVHCDLFCTEKIQGKRYHY